MVINCTLKKEVNPREVNYTWFSCDSANCDKEVSDSSLLRLNSIQNPEMKYQCRAKNDAGSANISIEVFETERSNVNSKCNNSGD